MSQEHNHTGQPLLSQSQRRQRTMLRIVLPVLLVAATAAIFSRWDQIAAWFKVTTIADTHLLGHLQVNGAIPVPRGRFDGETLKIIPVQGKPLELAYSENQKAFLATNHNSVRIASDAIARIADWMANLLRPSHEADHSGPNVGLHEISPSAGSGTRIEVTIMMGTSKIAYALVVNDRFVRVADEASVYQVPMIPISTDIRDWMIPSRTMLAASEIPKLEEISYRRNSTPEQLEDIRLIQKDGRWYLNQPGTGNALEAVEVDGNRVARILHYAQNLPFKGAWPEQSSAKLNERLRPLAFHFAGGQVRSLQVGDPFLYLGKEAPVIFEHEPGIYAAGYVQVGELMPLAKELLPQNSKENTSNSGPLRVGSAAKGLLVVYIGHMNDTLKLTPMATERTLESAIRSAQAALARIDKDSKRFAKDGGSLRALQDAANYYSDWREPDDPNAALTKLEDFPLSAEDAAELIQIGASLDAGTWEPQPVVLDAGLFVLYKVE